jgi:hypothetical protein
MRPTLLVEGSGSIRAGGSCRGLVVGMVAARDEGELVLLRRRLRGFEPIVDWAKLMIWATAVCDDLGDVGEIAISLERMALAAGA